MSMTRRDFVAGIAAAAAAPALAVGIGQAEHAPADAKPPWPGDSTGGLREYLDWRLGDGQLPAAPTGWGLCDSNGPVARHRITSMFTLLALGDLTGRLDKVAGDIGGMGMFFRHASTQETVPVTKEFAVEMFLRYRDGLYAHPATWC